MKVTRRPSPPVLLAAGYALLLLAWAGANSPGSAPDEPANLTRALGVAYGDVRGRPDRYDRGVPEFLPEQRPWIDRVTRGFDVPARKTFPGISTCNAFRPAEPSSCIPASLEALRRPGRVRSHVGTYQPFAYAAAGIAARVAPGGAAAAMWAARLVIASMSGLLLLLAARSVWTPGAGAWPLVGIYASVTPMTLFLGSSLSPNGVEVMAAVAFLCGLLRLGRAGPPSSRAAWWAVACGGALLAMSRSLGPVFVVAGVALAATAVGVKRSGEVLRRDRPAALRVTAVLAASALASLGWEIVVQPRPPRDIDTASRWLSTSIGELPELVRHQIGVFGWLDVNMPALAYNAWRLLLLALLGVASLVATRRHRRAIAATVVVSVLGAVGLSVAVVRQTGFGMQGRYILPLAVAVPLVAGEVALANRRFIERWSRWLPTGASTVAASVHLVGWYANARRNAVGITGPIAFVRSAEWVPPGGWPPWIAIAIAACAMLIAAALAAKAGATDRRLEVRPA